MRSLASKYVVSVSDVKKNPTAILRDSKRQTVAVLNHNKPVFYMVDPQIYESLLEAAYDSEMECVVRERQALRDQAVEVAPEDL